mmetsp:Transcript_93933/g.218341  ORF Transcript_93933/g.218341 Transcript_93933/m.218341 type:complete len:232 (+) Transcript_93933:717-1412(+)
MRVNGVSPQWYSAPRPPMWLAAPKSSRAEGLGSCGEAAAALAAPAAVRVPCRCIRCCPCQSSGSARPGEGGAHAGSSHCRLLALPFCWTHPNRVLEGGESCSHWPRTWSGSRNCVSAGLLGARRGHGSLDRHPSADDQRRELPRHLSLAHLSLAHLAPGQLMRRGAASTLLGAVQLSRLRPVGQRVLPLNRVLAACACNRAASAQVSTYAPNPDPLHFLCLLLQTLGGDLH